MKIAVATNNEKTIASHVGKCKAFLIYEINDNKITKIELRKNTFTNHWQQTHGSGHHRHQEHGGHGHGRLVEGIKDCTCLIFKSGGWRMIDNLLENGIKPVITDEQFADDAVNKYLAGKLEEKELVGCDTHKD